MGTIAAALPSGFANPLFDASMETAPHAGPLTARTPAAANIHEIGDVSTVKRAGFPPAGHDALQTWFPQRQPLLRPRAGSGRQTSARAFNLQLRLPGEVPAPLLPRPVLMQAAARIAAAPAATPLAPAATPRMQRTPATVLPSLDAQLATLLQQAAHVRHSAAAATRRAGSGRQATRRRLSVRLPALAAPPTPYFPTPEALPARTPLPGTPGTALRRASLRSALRSMRGRSASFDTPVEGVPERFGPLLQPKTPALAFSPMEGVPERLGPLLPPPTCAKRLPTTTPGHRRSRARTGGDDASASPMQQDSAARRRLLPGESAVLASAAGHGASDGGDEDGRDSPVGGLTAAPVIGTPAQGGVRDSSSGSFSFTRGAAALAAAAGPGAAPALPRYSLAGFLCADGRSPQPGPEDEQERHQQAAPPDASAGAAQRNCAPQTPWRLRDYEPSPALAPPQPRQNRQSPQGQPALASALDPSPLPQHQQQRQEEHEQGQPAFADYDDDDDCNDYDGGYNDGFDAGGGEEDFPWGGEDNHTAMDEAGAAAQDGEVGTPEYEERAGDEEPGLAEPDEAAAPQDAQQRPAKRSRPNSGNQRLKREFRARKSLAGVGLQATPHRSKRRSTRASCRPLEWWRNEHKVYERKFRSLPTVEHNEMHSASPRWQFVSDYKKPRTKSRTQEQ